MCGSSAKFSVAAKRTARRSRSLSSAIRAAGSPIARSTFASKSATPPTWSITAPVAGFSNRPLIVKSRRAASFSGVLNRTESGRRPSA